MMLRQHERDVQQLGLLTFLVFLSGTQSHWLRPSSLQCGVSFCLRALKKASFVNTEALTPSDFLKYVICFFPFHRKSWYLLLKILTFKKLIIFLVYVYL